MVVYSITAPPNEGIMFIEKNTTLKVNQNLVGDGSLYLTDTSLCWFCESQNRGIAVPWKNVIMHAKASDPEGMLYVQIDSVYTWNNEPNPVNLGGEGNPQNHALPPDEADGDNNIDEDFQDDFQEDEEKMTELNFVPSRLESLTSIYGIMNECQAMNPDPMEDEDDEGDSDFEEWEENGSGDMRQLNINDDFDEGQFEDAE